VRAPDRWTSSQKRKEHVEPTASLVPTAAKSGELDAVVAALKAAPGVDGAAWTVSATS
jgi:hypothetical protein